LLQLVPSLFVRATSLLIVELRKPSATLDASEFRVCSIVLTFVFLMFCTRGLANHLWAK
jgi:hypothetical protein